LSDNIAEAYRLKGTELTGYTDSQSLTFLIDNLQHVVGAKFPITIRLHPSENVSNWNWALEAYGQKVRLSLNESLVRDFVDHEIVTGSNSIAMVHAAYCGKRVLCVLRPQGQNPNIPPDGIELLRSLVDTESTRSV